jgi:hypothetical protein
MKRHRRFARRWLACQSSWLPSAMGRTMSPRLRRPIHRSFELEFDLNRPKSRPLVRPPWGIMETRRFCVERLSPNMCANVPSNCRRRRRLICSAAEGRHDLLSDRPGAFAAPTLVCRADGRHDDRNDKSPLCLLCNPRPASFFVSLQVTNWRTESSRADVIPTADTRRRRSRRRRASEWPTARGWRCGRRRGDIG